MNLQNLHSLGCPHTARTKRLHAGVESSVHFNLAEKGSKSTNNDTNDVQTMGLLNQNLHVCRFRDINIL